MQIENVMSALAALGRNCLIEISFPSSFGNDRRQYGVELGSGNDYLMSGGMNWQSGHVGELDPEAAAYLGRLHGILLASFNREELRQLCFKLGIDFDDLEGTTRTAKARELLLYFWRQGRLPDLAAAVKNERPQVDWPPVPAELRGRPTGLTGLALLDRLHPIERLAEMPEHEIPEPGPIPPGSRIILSSNPYFTGRQAALRRLVRSLKAHGGTIVVSGLGGVGKTQLAAEFALRYGRYFAGGVLWLSFAEPTTIPTEMIACGMRMRLHEYFAEMSPDRQLELVLAQMEGPIPRLIIFDNCDGRDAPELLDKWRPKSGEGRLLVTSRRSAWETVQHLDSLRLRELSPTQSVDLLNKHLPGIEPGIAGEIAEELGRLPLALYLAGCHLNRYRRVTPERYLASLRQPDLLQHPSMRGHGLSARPTGRELNVGRTFALSYERLDSTDQVDVMAMALLARAASFPSGEPVSLELLLEKLPDRPDLRWDNAPGLLVEDALYRLDDLGMIELATDDKGILRSVTVHRLLSLFIQSMLDEKETK
jgi:hypothetical protein